MNDIGRLLAILWKLLVDISFKLMFSNGGRITPERIKKYGSQNGDVVMTALFAAAPPSQSISSRRTASTAEDERDVVGVRKKKITISLSEKSLRAMEELRLATDADTDSEVFRNALRLHLALIRAHSEGVQLFMKRHDKEEIVPVTLFADVDSE